LILRKIIKIVATRCQILRLKCTKFDLQHSPDPLAGFKGPTSKGREGNGGGRREGKREREEGEGRGGEKGGKGRGKGREGEGKDPPLLFRQIKP